MNRYLMGLNVLAVMAAFATGGQKAQAAVYSCYEGQQGTCKFKASCEDDFYRWVSECKIQCMHNLGGGQLEDTSSATCGQDENN
jgi:hypothetical protein